MEGRGSVEFVPCYSSDEDEAQAEKVAESPTEEPQQMMSPASLLDSGEMPVMDVREGGSVERSEEENAHEPDRAPTHPTPASRDLDRGSVNIEDAMPRIRSSYLQRRLEWDLDEDLAEQHCYADTSPPVRERGVGRFADAASDEDERGVVGSPTNDVHERSKEWGVQLADDDVKRSSEVLNKELDLSGRCLNVVPDKVCRIRMLTKLDLSNNQIRDLPDHLGNLPLLVELHLHHNLLYNERVQSEHLMRASLSHSTASAMGSSFYSSYSRGSPIKAGQVAASFASLLRLKELEVLDLSNNQLCAVPDEVFSLRKLRILSLSNNHIAEIPAGVERLAALEHFNIECNALVFLPQEISRLSSLKSFVAYDNQIGLIHEQLRFPATLETLDLSRNLLTSAHPVHFRSVHALLSLHLSGNQMTYLDEELFEPTPMGMGRSQWFAELEDFHVSDNQIQHLPQSIGALTKLTTLNIARNAIRTLPNSIEALHNLKNLYACGNQLTELPQHFGRMFSLLYADLSSNRLHALPASIGDLCYLRRLKLRHNRLRSLPPQIGTLPRLLDLDLFNNNELMVPPPDVVSQGVNAVLSFMRELPREESEEMEEGWQVLKSSGDEFEVMEGGERESQGEQEVVGEDQEEPGENGRSGDAPDDDDGGEGGGLLWNAASSAGWVLLGVTTALTTLAMGRRGLV